MEYLNDEFNSNLTPAIEIFKGNYHKKFMFQLISSQLDMDRIDYLKRDSFYTGAAEGNINSERIITMLNVAKNNLVVEEKGIYSVEKFLVARRLMYWQVYLHKTGLVAEQLLIRILKRAKELISLGRDINCSKALLYFLNNDITKKSFGSTELKYFARLDDSDITSALKLWQEHEDTVLKTLCGMIVNRILLKIKISKEKIDEEEIINHKKRVESKYLISSKEADYFVFTGIISNQAYRENNQSIEILYKSGKTEDIIKASDQLNLKALSQPVSKYYICYPKN